MNRRVNVDISDEVMRTNNRSERFTLAERKVQPFFSPFCFHRSCEVIDWVGEDDQIYHITCPIVNGDKLKDLVVLVSRRRPLKDG